MYWNTLGFFFFRCFIKAPSCMYLIYYLPKDIDISFSTGNLLGEGVGRGKRKANAKPAFIKKAHYPLGVKCLVLNHQIYRTYP